jgi:hypothetical protein
MAIADVSAETEWAAPEDAGLPPSQEREGAAAEWAGSEWAASEEENQFLLIRVERTNDIRRNYWC